MIPLFLPPRADPAPQRNTPGPTPTRVWRAPVWYTSRLIEEN